jgi:hypothetical protein
MSSAPAKTSKPQTTKIDDEYDIEPRAYEIAGEMNPENEEERQFIFRHLRQGMNEAWKAGRHSMRPHNRIRNYITRKRLGL